MTWCCFLQTPVTEINAEILKVISVDDILNLQTLKDELDVHINLYDSLQQHFKGLYRRYLVLGFGKDKTSFVDSLEGVNLENELRVIYSKIQSFGSAYNAVVGRLNSVERDGNTKESFSRTVSDDSTPEPSCSQSLETVLVDSICPADGFHNHESSLLPKEALPPPVDLLVAEPLDVAGSRTENTFGNAFSCANAKIPRLAIQLDSSLDRPHSISLRPELKDGLPHIGPLTTTPGPLAHRLDLGRVSEILPSRPCSFIKQPPVLTNPTTANPRNGTHINVFNTLHQVFYACVYPLQYAAPPNAEPSCFKDQAHLIAFIKYAMQRFINVVPNSTCLDCYVESRLLLVQNANAVFCLQELQCSWQLKCPNNLLNRGFIIDADFTSFGHAHNNRSLFELATLPLVLPSNSCGSQFSLFHYVVNQTITTCEYQPAFTSFKRAVLWISYRYSSADCLPEVICNRFYKVFYRVLFVFIDYNTVLSTVSSVLQLNEFYFIESAKWILSALSQTYYMPFISSCGNMCDNSSYALLSFCFTHKNCFSVYFHLSTFFCGESKTLTMIYNDNKSEYKSSVYSFNCFEFSSNFNEIQNFYIGLQNHFEADKFGFEIDIGRPNGLIQTCICTLLYNYYFDFAGGKIYFIPLPMDNG